MVGWGVEEVDTTVAAAASERSLLRVFYGTKDSFEASLGVRREEEGRVGTGGDHQAMEKQAACSRRRPFAPWPRLGDETWRALGPKREHT
jgi:hypothetical protein